jgi:hypothetical protein
MLDWLDAIPNLGVPGVEGGPAQISAGYSGTPAKTAGVLGVPEQRKTADPEVVGAEWRAGLATLAYSAPPSGMTTMRWGQLLDDAEFIFNGFGEQLVREGWSAYDVFGVLPWRERGGVLLDRLQGARNLKLDGEGRAFWSHHGATMQTCRGAAESLIASGLMLVWELPR